MKMRPFYLAIVISICLAAAGFATPKFTDELAAKALSTESTDAELAIRELRTMGAVGLDALFVKYAAEIERYSRTGDADANWLKVAAALDTVAQQKDSYASHLYWFTDLDEAKRVAKAKHKPILSLRLLGNLNEEFSCANSRLFRAILYPNADISKYLRENYILHWKSVRPAPRITIDFGDGRKIERTITGNSIHYILNEQGTIIDALPGLYSPKAFLKYITQANEASKLADSRPQALQPLALMQYRKKNFDEIKTKRDKGIEVSGVQLVEPKAGTIAILAAPMAMAKMIVVDEYSILRVYDNFAKFEPAINFDDWNKLAGLYSPSPKLDANSIAFIRRQNAKTGLSEVEFSQLFAKLDSYLALDTTRNDFAFHTKLYEWLNQNPSENLESLNARVYADMFKTPNSDKWLGLYSTDVYTALDGNGIIK